MREAGQGLSDIAGNTDTVDWGERLDQYMSEVSVRVLGEGFSLEMMALGLVGPPCIMSVMLTDETVKP